MVRSPARGSVAHGALISSFFAALRAGGRKPISVLVRHLERAEHDAWA